LNEQSKKDDKNIKDNKKDLIDSNKEGDNKLKVTNSK
jgi:hypothetical protein